MSQKCEGKTHRAAVKSTEMAGLLSQVTPRFARRAMTIFHRTLRSDDPLAIGLTTALKQGDVEQLSRLLAAEPDLASCVVRNEKGGGRTPLHLFADWPGQIPNAAAIVHVLKRHGANLDAAAVDMRHHETPLHWAASNDDVALIDALLDAGANFECGRLIDRRRSALVLGRRLRTCGPARGALWVAARRPSSGTMPRWADGGDRASRQGRSVVAR